MFTVCANACFNLFTMDWVKPSPSRLRRENYVEDRSEE